MITIDKVTQMFCIIDDFCKYFDEENGNKLLLCSSNRPKRQRSASLSDSEIITLFLCFHFVFFHNFKHYYLFFIKGILLDYFSNAVSYNRFVELQSRVFLQLMFFLNSEPLEDVRASPSFILQ